MTGHYISRAGHATDSSYYRGDVYVDHEAQSVGEHEEVLKLLKQYHAPGPVLEVGCATGGFLATLKDDGYEAVGVDISAWAVDRANERVGSNQAWVCNIEDEELPVEITNKGPFGTLVLWAVFEHFRRPFSVLAKLDDVALPGTMLFINTTNAESLTRALFKEQWEGYFDWTHHGVDQVSVSFLREKLPPLGWRITHLSTHLAWDGSADPTRATIRDWYGADARFRRLLSERHLGDLITCVAIKE
ncbi:MAG TPA: methyltransferase domain-containing protein [Pyrinomonadaceae bacterium]|jgi:2-polyprenyl-3-methyl-5-hydroxy-6-metoxy-1,4-benzoquinol methylase